MTTEVEPQTATEETTGDNADDDANESSTTCTICMEEWAIGSDHRVCCLKCGHLFGRSCIERWIKEKGTSAKCPTCQKATKKLDIRDLWVKSIKAVDNTEIMALTERYESERKGRKTDSAVIFHQNIKIELLNTEIDNLKKENRSYRERCVRLQGILENRNKLRNQQIGALGENQDIDMENISVPDMSDLETLVVEPQEMKGKFHFAEKIESSICGGCKCFAICPTTRLVLVAQPAPQGTGSMFGGHGLRRYSMVDTTIKEFIPLHTKMITSVQMKPIGDLILTSSQDRKVRVTSVNNKVCILSYQCDAEPTCVNWSLHRDQQFYVSSANCFVSLYDLRNTSQFIYQTSQKVANTRLLSAASVTGDGLNGLLVNDAKGSQFLELSENSDYSEENIDRGVDHLTKCQLPFEGLMGTVDFNKQLNLALISTRRTNMSSNTAHNLVRLRKSTSGEGASSKVECSRVKTFFGGNSGERLSQSRILKHPTLQEHVLVGSCDEDARGVRLWDSSDSKPYQSIKTDAFVRDMCIFTPENTNQHMLYTLSDKGFGIYRWDYA